jgi:hypothetical protein
MAFSSSHRSSRRAFTTVFALGGLVLGNVSGLAVAQEGDARDAPSAALPPLPPPPAESAPAAPVVQSEPPAPAGVAATAGIAPTAPAEDVVSDDTADERPTTWRTQPLAIELPLGLGAPTGFIGVAIDYAPVPVLALNAGVGFGGSGLQYAFAARARIFRFEDRKRRNHLALYLGAGVSSGVFDSAHVQWNIPVDGSQSFTEDPVAHVHFDHAVWGNLEAGIEIRLGSHLQLRPFLGAAALLDPNDGVAVAGERGEAPDPVERWSPYIGLALG